MKLRNKNETFAKEETKMEKELWYQFIG